MKEKMPAKQLANLQSDAERRHRSSSSTGDSIRGRPLAWRGVQTQMDAAKEYLRQSLYRLAPDQTFAIIAYADETRVFPRSGFALATQQKLAAALQFVDSVRAEGVGDLYQALEAAFALGTGRGRGGAYVNQGLLSTGADTIVLLGGHSHGVAQGSHLPDPLPRAIHEALGTPWVEHGNFTDPLQILESARRLNMYRDARIHCVGLGHRYAALGNRAGVDPISELARIGQGDRYWLGLRTSKWKNPWGRPAEQAPARAKLLWQFARAADPANRIDVLKRIEQAGVDEDIMEHFVIALDDRSELVREHAARALGRVTGHEGVAFLASGPYGDRRRAQREWRRIISGR